MFCAQDHQQITELLKPSFPQLNRFHIVERSAAETNNGYSSDIIRLTVEYQDDDKPEVKHLVLKVPGNSNPTITALFEEYDILNRERTMYTKILPEVNNLLKAPVSPSYYATINPNVIILENVTLKGFECCRSGQLLPLQQCYPVIEALAHFHAATHKLQRLHPRYLDDQLFNKPILFDKLFKMVLAFDAVIQQVLRRKNALHLQPKFEAAKAFFRDSSEVAAAEMGHSHFEFVVLNHADFRKDNLLFKYNSAGALEAVQFLDFQTCVWTSPVNDLVYFIISSLPIAEVEHHFNQLVDWYLRCLNEKLRELEVGSTYQQADFMKDLKKISYYMVLVSVVSICMVYPFEKSQLETLISPNESDKEGFYSEYLEDEYFVNTVLRKLEFCDKLGMFDAFQNGDSGSH